MIANPEFAEKDLVFWANVRTVSQSLHYSTAGGLVRNYELAEIERSFGKLGLKTDHLWNNAKTLTPMGSKLLAYLAFRSKQLNEYVCPRLMAVRGAIPGKFRKDAATAEKLLSGSGAQRDRTRTAAKVDRLRKLADKVERDEMKQRDVREVYEEIARGAATTRRAKRNKQGGALGATAYLTEIVRLLIEKHGGSLKFDADPQLLTTITQDGYPLRTLARRVDGVVPKTTDPIAVWEIKEYYYTTTFGSRVADGIYETLLDGMELKELRESTARRDVKHYLIVDAHFTWWGGRGRPYLCRIVDMLHMGYLDEALFGYEVVERLPEIIRGWPK